MDLGLIPYRITPYTASVYPTKLNEYLAMGLPVVSSAIEEVVCFQQENPDLVEVAGEAEQFAERIRAHLLLSKKRQADIVKATGLSRAQVSRICNGHREPSAAQLAAIADVLELDDSETEVEA